MLLTAFIAIATHPDSLSGQQTNSAAEAKQASEDEGKNETLELLQGSWELNNGIVGGRMTFGEDNGWREDFWSRMRSMERFDFVGDALETQACYDFLNIELTTNYADEAFADFKNRIGEDSSHLVAFKLKNGKSIVVGVSRDQESLVLRSPPGCCSRSGTVFRFSKLAKQAQVDQK